MCSKRRFLWSKDLEILLIEVWEERAFDLRRQKRNSHVYAEMAAHMKRLAPGTPRILELEGIDLKVKINNLTQRYRAERKVIDPSGGRRSDWRLFESVHKILESLPCNDDSLIQKTIHFEGITPINESNSFTQKTELFIKVEDQSNELLEQSLSPTPSSSGDSAAPSFSTKRKVKEREAQETFDADLIREIKRSNDIAEEDLRQNQAIKEATLKAVQALEASANAMLALLTNKNVINK